MVGDLRKEVWVTLKYLLKVLIYIDPILPLFLSQKTKHKYSSSLLGSEVLIVVAMKSSTFWNITPCSPVKVNQHFEGTIASTFTVQEHAKHKASCLHHVGFLAGLFFNSEDGGSMFV
jgi:hypothetical protein